MDDSHTHADGWPAAIASYLRDHPHSSDSAEGIARWWLDAPVSEWPRVRCALQSMVKDGRLEHYAAANGREHYRLPAAVGGTPEP